MTSVSAMKFSKNSGAIVADEQSSNRFRKYDIATKLHESSSPKVQAVFGASGTSDVIHNVMRRFSLEYPAERIESGEMAAELLGCVAGRVKREYINGFLRTNYGISETEFQAGHRILADGTRLPINQDLMNRYRQIIEGQEEGVTGYLDCTFLALAADQRDIQIYVASMAGEKPLTIARPYSCIGSGMDMADGELSGFFENMPRDERENINPLEGIAALLYATERASTRNVGVGGTPLIKVIKNKSIISPGELSSRLAMEIVKATRNGLLSEQFRNESLDALVFNGGDVHLIEGEMWKTTEDPQKLSRYLRGYKIN